MRRTLIACSCLIMTFSSICLASENICSSENTEKPGFQLTSSPHPAPIQKISDNPGFFTAVEVTARAPEVKDLDELFRPILAGLFDDARLVEESETPEQRADGEVIKNRMAYVVRMILTPQEGDNLHAALKKAGFAASQRRGGKPLHYKSTVSMSFMKTTRLGGYSLVIVVDSIKQRIEIISYKLGS